MNSLAFDAPIVRAAISASKTSACPPRPSFPKETSLPPWKAVAAAPTLKKPDLLILEPSVDADHVWVVLKVGKQFLMFVPGL